MPSAYLTLSGIEKLQNELEYLRKVKRPEIAGLLRDTNSWDQSDGDSDPEFDMAKHQQAFIEGRIQEIEVLLSNPSIIDEYLHGDIVEIGSKVTITENGGQPVTYTIVGPVEASPSKGLISFASPFGKSLLGRSKGDEVIIKAPGGEYQVRIVEVS